jgi:hypothetical protein
MMQSESRLHIQNRQINLKILARHTLDKTKRKDVGGTQKPRVSARKLHFCHSQMPLEDEHGIFKGPPEESCSASAPIASEQKWCATVNNDVADPMPEHFPREETIRNDEAPN